MRTLFLHTLCILALAFILHGSIAYAATTPYIPLAPINVQGSEFRSDAQAKECVPPTCFPRYLRTLYNVRVMLAGLFAVLSIVRGGFTLMWTDSILGHSEAKGIILRALGGLLIVYSSYIFMNPINPALGRALDRSLNFPKVPKAPEPALLTIVSAQDLEDQLKKRIDTVNPQIRALVTERDAKLKLAAEKSAAANATGANAPTDTVRAELLAEAATLRNEAAALDTKQKAIGDVNADAGRVERYGSVALDTLWNTSYGAKDWIGPFPIRTASKTERIAEANRLLVKMDEEGQKINALPDGADKTAALKVFNDTKKILQDQIRYFKNGCDRATGMKTETYSVDRGPDRTRVVPCPS